MPAAAHQGSFNDSKPKQTCAQFAVPLFAAAAAVRRPCCARSTSQLASTASSAPPCADACVLLPAMQQGFGMSGMTLNYRRHTQLLQVEAFEADEVDQLHQCFWQHLTGCTWDMVCLLQRQVTCCAAAAQAADGDGRRRRRRRRQRGHLLSRLNRHQKGLNELRSPASSTVARSGKGHRLVYGRGLRSMTVAACAVQTANVPPPVQS